MSIEHITPVLRNVLHWLPVPQRIQFKTAFLAFNCIRGTGPAYFQHVCVLTANFSGRDSLHFVEHGYLAVPRTAMKLGKQSLCVAAPEQSVGTSVQVIHLQRTVSVWLKDPPLSEGLQPLRTLWFKSVSN